MLVREILSENDLKQEFPPAGKAIVPIKNGSVLLTYQVKNNPWPGSIRVNAQMDKKTIGELVYTVSQQHIHDMYVDPKYRRLGINTAMHEYLESILGQLDPSYGLKISNSLSPDGAKFYNVHPRMDAGKPWRHGRQ